MSYKILTKNGIDHTNIDGARGEYFNSGMRDGIVQGALNEGLFTATASNIISLDTCELRIAGHRIVIDEPVYHTFTNAPSSDTRYAFVAQIVVDDNQNVDFSLFVQTASTSLIQNDLYKNITGVGTYQVEIGRFTLLTSLTIEDVVRTIDVITGGTGKGSGANINIGNVTTQTLDSDVNAEVDVSERYEEDEGKEYLDFQFGIPKGDKGDKGEQGIQGIQGDKGDKGDTGAAGDEALTTSYVFSETTDPNPDIVMLINDRSYFNRTPKDKEYLIMLWNNTSTGDTFICNCETLTNPLAVGCNIIILSYYKLSKYALTTSYVFSMASDPNPNIVMLIQDNSYFNRTPENNEDLIVLWNNTATGDTFICNCKTQISSLTVGTNIQILSYYKLSAESVNIVQTTGQSTTDVMSQKAVTDLVGDISTVLASVVTVSEV